MWEFSVVIIIHCPIPNFLCNSSGKQEIKKCRVCGFFYYVNLTYESMPQKWLYIFLNSTCLWTLNKSLIVKKKLVHTVFTSLKTVTQYFVNDKV